MRNKHLLRAATGFPMPNSDVLARPATSDRVAPIAIDLFSGCGGMTEGLKGAGFEVVAGVELDEKACDTYEANHPSVKLRRGDIRSVPARTLMRELNLRPGELDLLAGCPPCQGFSRIRRLNRKSIARDGRNDLIFDFLRFARAFRPKALLFENVSRLRLDRRFSAFCKALKAIGYRFRTAVLDASDFGVPQRRHRLIFMAIKKVDVPELKVRRERKQTVRMAIGTLSPPGCSGDAIHDMSMKHSEKVSSIIRNIPIDGGSRSSLPEHLKLPCHQDTDGFRDVYGRMSWDAPAPTITGGCFNPSKGRFLHPEQNRAISLREASLLQGFPSQYVFFPEHGKSAISLMIGNALPPPLIKAQAKMLAELIQK